MARTTKYYGLYEIEKEESIDRGERVLLYFKSKEVELPNGEKKDYQPEPIEVALRAYNDCVTEEALDWDEHRTKRLRPVVEKILATLLEYDVPIGRGEGVSSDIQYLLQLVNTSIEKWRKAVEDHLWGSKEESKTMAELHYHFLDSMGVEPKDEVQY